MRRIPESSSTSSCSSQPSQADRDHPGHGAQRRELERGGQVVDVAELPARRGVAHDQEPGSLEVPGEHAVDAGPDHGRGTDDGHLQTGVAARRLRREPFDLEPVRHQPAVRDGAQRRVLGQRDVVVGQRAVDHRRRAEHDPAYAGGRRRGEHRLGAPHVELTLDATVTLQGGVDGEVHDGVDLAEPGRERGVADVEDPPGHPLGLATAVVQADHLRDVRVGHQPGRHRCPQAGGGPGDGDHRAPGPAGAPRANGAHRDAVGGTHRRTAGVGSVKRHPRSQHPVDTVGRAAVMVRPSCQLRAPRGGGATTGRPPAGTAGRRREARREQLPLRLQPGLARRRQRLRVRSRRLRPAGRPVLRPDGRRRRHRRRLLPARPAAVLPGRPGELGPRARRGPADRVRGG